MRSIIDPDRREVVLALTAGEQHGVVARRQALEAGVSSSLIKRRVGAWIRLHAGVYRIAAHPASWRQSLFAACLAAGPPAAISHNAGAALYGLDGFDEGDLPELTVGREGRIRIKECVVHRARSLPEADLTTRDGIPVMSVARTLIDIAATCDAERVERALDSALRLRLASKRWLEWRIDEVGDSLNGSTALRRLLAGRDQMSAASESRLESRLLPILRAGRIPGLVAQHEVFDHGHLVARLDFAIPRARIAIEADGYVWHEGRRHWRRDRTRQTELASLGWLVLTFTWEDLEQPDVVIDRVRRAVAHRAGAPHGGPA